MIVLKVQSVRNAQAQTMLKPFESFEFVFMAHLMMTIFGYTNDLNHAMQRRDQDIVNAIDLIYLIKIQLQLLREDKGWEDFLKSVNSFCVKHGIKVADMDGLYKPVGRDKRFFPKAKNQHRFHVNMFLSIIDRQHRELNDRFDEKKNLSIGNTQVTDPGSTTVEKVMQEATVALYPRHQQDDTRDRAMINRDMLSRPSDQEKGTIFFKGLKLRRELEKLGKEPEAVIRDEVLRWKAMAEFWAETILYVAPSDNVRGHVEQLANGGEFLTHVWALLYHAGILTRQRRQLESSQDIV